MTVYVVTVDWKDRIYEPELVGVYADENKAREVQGDKVLDLAEQGFSEGEDFYVWFEETYVIQ